MTDQIPAPRTFAEAAEQMREAAGKHPKNRKREEYKEFASGVLKKMADILDTWAAGELPFAEHPAPAVPVETTAQLMTEVIGLSQQLAEASPAPSVDALIEATSLHVHEWVDPTFPGGYHTCKCLAVGVPNTAVAGWPIMPIQIAATPGPEPVPAPLPTGYVIGMDGSMIPALPLPSDGATDRIDHQRLALRRFAKESGALDLFSLPPMLDESRYREDTDPKA